MAVKAWDVLEGAARCATLADALEGVDWVFATTSRRGMSGVLTARQAATRIVEEGGSRQVAILFGNEKTGLSEEDLGRAAERIRIPMAADQPSINLAQATQLVAYELFVAALELRNRAQRAL
jgi:tRNA C32,U32 (ribose-2'-O)-methylase TrmJ